MTRDEALKLQIKGATVYYQGKPCYISQLSYPFQKSPPWAYVIGLDNDWGFKVLVEDLTA